MYVERSAHRVSPTGVRRIWSDEAALLTVAAAESLLSRSTLSRDRIWKVLPQLSILSWEGGGEEGMSESSTTLPDIALSVCLSIFIANTNSTGTVVAIRCYSCVAA